MTVRSGILAATTQSAPARLAPPGAGTEVQLHAITTLQDSAMKPKASKTPGVRWHHGGWIAQAWIPDPSHPRGGRNHYRTFPSEEQAALWRSQVRVAERHAGGARLRKRGDVPTLRDAGDVLLDGMLSGAIRKRGGGEYRAGVIRAYRRGLTRNVYPVLGGLRLSEIGQPDLLELVEQLQAAGLAPSTIRNALDPVRVLYRRAVARGVVTANPTTNLELPSGERKRDRVADPAEASRLITALPRADDRALWAVALYGGLRAGELRALRWQDVDLAAGRIRVERNLPVDAARIDAAAETVEPKTKAGRREVPLAPPAREALIEWKADSVSALPMADAYVWPGADGGPFARTSVMKRARAAWKTAELPEIGLHEARHSAASMWIASGWSIKVVSELIGHASIAITLDRYGHLLPGALDDASAAFAAYLERADSAARLDQLG
jgi:integrase